jgi:hypothetical protein
MNKEMCKTCGREVKMMCQKMTGFCTPKCAERFHVESGET